MGKGVVDASQAALNQAAKFSLPPPVQGGINSYGTVIGVIASIAIVVLLIVIPLFYAFKAVYSKIQTNQEMMGKVQMNLAENRFQALQKAAPGRLFQAEDLRIGRVEYGALLAEGYSPERIESDIQALLEGQELEECPEPLRQIVEKERMLHAMTSGDQERYLPNLKKSGLSESEVIALAEEGKTTRHLEAFLLKKGSLGSDPTSERFKAGKELVQYGIAYLNFEKDAFEINEVIQAIQNAPKEGLEVYLQTNVRERLDRLQKSLAYQVLLKIEGRKHPFVRAVQDLSVALRLEAHGIEQLQDLGARYTRRVKEALGPVPKESAISYLAEALDETIGKYHWSYKIESLFDKLLVYRSYPDKTAMAVLSHQPDRALDYNSYQVGNFDMAVGDYELEGRKIRAIHGPTPTSDQLLIAQLEAQQQVGGIHLQHNLEHPAFSRGDRVRIEYLLGVEKDFPKTFRLMSTPLDGPAMRLQGESGDYFKSCQTVREFFLKYGTYAFTGRTDTPAEDFGQLEGEAHRRVDPKKDNGFYLGKEVMSDDQFRLAFECASSAFAGVDLSHEKSRYLRALQVGLQGFLAVGAVVKTLQDAYHTPAEAEEALLQATFGQACKLDIDRGVILNVMTRVYFQLAAGKPLTEEDISEIIGTVVGRAELVSGRTIIFDRYQPLSDALRLIGANEGAVTEALKRYLSEGFGVEGADLNFQRA
ncbi:MAG: hypothetical protein H7A38_06825 [Chlamydiales bacterium]|nr:hypothetical protein [Chlamydiales bacterium]